MAEISAGALSGALKRLAKANVESIRAALLLAKAVDHERTSDQPLSVLELSRKCGLTNSSGSRIAWDLHDAGFFRFEVDPRDRRKRIVRIVLKKVAALGL